MMAFSNFLQDHDGTPELNMPYKIDVFMQTYRKHPDYAGDGLSDDSDLELDNLSKTPLSRPGPQLSRLEQKALDKEIPWQPYLQWTQGCFGEV